MKTAGSSASQARETSAERHGGNGGLMPDETLNLIGENCPMNFVRTKLKLQKMKDGQNLEVVVNTGEPMRSIPRAIKEEGHRIIHAEKLNADSFSLLIQKGGGV